MLSFHTSLFFSVSSVSQVDQVEYLTGPDYIWVFDLWVLGYNPLIIQLKAMGNAKDRIIRLYHIFDVTFRRKSNYVVTWNFKDHAGVNRDRIQYWVCLHHIVFGNTEAGGDGIDGLPGFPWLYNVFNMINSFIA